MLLFSEFFEDFKSLPCAQDACKGSDLPHVARKRARVQAATDEIVNREAQPLFPVIEEAFDVRVFL